MKIAIRKAVEADIPHIFALVEELAAYENSAHLVKVDEDYYKSEWAEGTFEAIVAEDENGILGTCIYYMTFSTWKGRCVYLEDFVVKEAHRKKGIGQMLYDHLLEESKAIKATMIRWQVLDWNEPAIKFYEKNKATIQKEWWDCKVYF